MSVFQAAIGWYINFYNRNRISNVASKRNSALNHIRVSQILYKYVLRRIKNQEIRLSIAEIINTAKTP
ncbi:hypothetical protein FD61_10415 [Streptococcus macedonicus]|nr:hypothetical protein FD61_10415 [Streptococcus macedonicus]